MNGRPQELPEEAVDLFAFLADAAPVVTSPNAADEDGLSFLVSAPLQPPPPPPEQPEPEGDGRDPIEVLVGDVARLEGEERELKSPWSAPVDRSTGIALALDAGRRLATLKQRHTALSGAARKRFETDNQAEVERLIACAQRWAIHELQAEHEAAAPARAAHAARLAEVAAALELARARLVRALTRRERQGGADGGVAA